MPDHTSRWDAIDHHIDVLERFATTFAGTLNPPIFYHSGADHYGFRFGKPDTRHFCLLKLVRVISALRSSTILARKGFAQEIFVILRTLTEFTTQIDYVILSKGTDDAPGDTLVDAFFADFTRHKGAEIGKIRLKQGDVHKTVGTLIDQQIEDASTQSDPTKKLMSEVYQALSLYVHGRYPEIMDMYGGDPGHWHMSGMSGTPKDEEITAFLETSVTTVSQSCRIIAAAFFLTAQVSEDPVLASWFNSSNDWPS